MKKGFGLEGSSVEDHFLYFVARRASEQGIIHFTGDEVSLSKLKELIFSNILSDDDFNRIVEEIRVSGEETNFSVLGAFEGMEYYQRWHKCKYVALPIDDDGNAIAWLYWWCVPKNYCENQKSEDIPFIGETYGMKYCRYEKEHKVVNFYFDQ